MKSIISWTEPLFVFKRNDRSTHNDLSGEGHENLGLWTKKVDLSEALEEIPPEEFPIDQFESKIDFENWLQEKFGGYEDGIYYLFTRCITVYPLPRKRIGRRGRPKYSYSSHGECAGRRQYFYGKPFRKAAGRWTCIAKFEISTHDLAGVAERRTMRKHSPYNYPKFPIIKAIEKRKQNETEF